jgi:hypothetical protein
MTEAGHEFLGEDGWQVLPNTAQANASGFSDGEDGVLPGEGSAAAGRGISTTLEAETVTALGNGDDEVVTNTGTGVVKGEGAPKSGDLHADDGIAVGIEILS